MRCVGLLVTWCCAGCLAANSAWDGSDGAASSSGPSGTSSGGTGLTTGTTSATTGASGSTSSTGPTTSTGDDGTRGDGGSSTGAEEPGWVVRGVQTFTGNVQNFELAVVSASEPDDLAVAIILAEYPAGQAEITAPAGFEERVRDVYSCGQYGSSLVVLTGRLGNPIPASLSFARPESFVTSAALMTIGGVSDIPDVTNLVESTGNPLTIAPIANGANASLGISVYTGPYSNDTYPTFTIPEGKTRVFEMLGMVVFVEALEPGGVLLNDSGVMTPEGCGFLYAAVHPIPTGA